MTWPQIVALVQHFYPAYSYAGIADLTHCQFAALMEGLSYVHNKLSPWGSSEPVKEPEADSMTRDDVAAMAARRGLRMPA